MIKDAQLIFMSSDGLKIYRKPNGTYLVRNLKELLSIVGCIMIDQNSCGKNDREIATKFLASLKRNKIYSIETGKLITSRW